MTNEKPSIIEVAALTKRFDTVQAVDGIDFSVKEGEIFGFLGPNGAGKTTTINRLIGLARPDSGALKINGIDCINNPRAAQNLIGVVPDESNLYPELSGFDNLCFCASLYGIDKPTRVQRAHELLEDFGLSKAANRKFGGYSKGMKRKLTIAAGIIHQPKVLIDWFLFASAAILIAAVSAFLGLFIAVAVSEVFEAQTFSNFFRFPMVFLCGLFFPIAKLSAFLKPLSYILPLTYGADILHGSVNSVHLMPYSQSFLLLIVFCIGLFSISLWNIRRKWIV